MQLMDNDSGITRWVKQELSRLDTRLAEPVVTGLRLRVLSSEPKKVAGMLVYADGTSWNPGSGAGVYVYSGSAWVKL